MENPNASPAEVSGPEFRPDFIHRKSSILQRWLLIILAAYLVVFRYLSTPNFSAVVIFVAVFASTNIVLTLIPPRHFLRSGLQRALCVTDILFVSTTLFLLRTPETYIYLGFILVFAIAAIWRELMVLVFSLVIVSLLYGAFSAFRMMDFGVLGTVEQFLTLALFFTVSIYYLFFSDRLLHDAMTATVSLEEQRRTAVLFEITRLMSSSMKTREILYLIVKRVCELFEARHCSILSVDAETRTTKMLVQFAESKMSEAKIEPTEHPELLKAYDSQEIVFVPDDVHGGTPKSAVVVPMRVKNVVLGLIYIQLNGTGANVSDSEERFLLVISAITANALKNAEMFQEMEQRAQTDFLTGLSNHRSFQTNLTTELGRAERHNHPLSLLVIDLDHLKWVNDKYGHPVGDLVIRGVADTIAKGCREFDIASRYGGEEFTVILPETSIQDAIMAAERFRAMIAAQDYPGVGRVTASIGVSTYPQDALGKEDLIRCADQALYSAKGKGRNRVEYRSPQTLTT